MVSFTHPTKNKEYRYVHELVTLCFLGPRPPGLEVCHNDGTRTNNDAGNLRYDTRQANALEGHAHARARRTAK